MSFSRRVPESPILTTVTHNRVHNATSKEQEQSRIRLTPRSPILEQDALHCSMSIGSVNNHRVPQCQPAIKEAIDFPFEPKSTTFMLHAILDSCHKTLL